MSGGGDKTEAPTQRRKEKAAEDGNILKSKDFATALVVMAGVAWLIFAGPSLIAACKAVMTASFQFDRTDVEDFSPWRPLQQAGWKLLPSLITLFTVSVVATIISSAGLGSLTWNNKLIAFKGERINPASGLKRILGPQGWIELGKSLLKVVLLAVIGGYMLWKSSRTTLGLSSSSLGDAVGALGGTFTGIMIAMAAGLVAIALFDVPIQIIQLLSKLKMTKQEVRDEHKDSEGRPEIKGRIRQMQREISQRRMMAAVPQADVVITNPTHYAVALKYDPEKGNAPMLLAKGADFSALKIREIATQHQIQLLESPALARSIYYSTELDQPIPAGLYLAVAQVLAYVYQIRQYRAGQGKPPPKPPKDDLPIPEDLRRDE